MPTQPFSERITRMITVLLRLALVVVSVLAVVSANWEVVIGGVGTLVLTYVPQLLAAQVNIRLPLQFEFAVALFLYATLYLGGVNDFYEKLWWWDIMLHAASSFAFGFAGFLILFVMHMRRKIQASPVVIAIFSFTFGLAIGVLWEFFEYGMDTFFGTNMQKSGLPDTMGDLMVDALGAGIASSLGYVYLKHDVWDPFDVLVGWFVRANPRFKAPK